MKTQLLTTCSLFTALHCICAWLCIPLGDTAVTLQTFSIALCLLVLGGKWGSISIFVYLLLGGVGLPVFSGFRGGMAQLLGTTGGYLWGFALGGLVYWIFSGKYRILPLILSIFTCYLVGSIWFWQVYTAGDFGSLGLVALKCVVPFLLPDALKIALASHISKRLKL